MQQLEPGASIIFREVWREQSWSTYAITMVADEPGRTVVYRPIGAPGMAPLAADGRAFRRSEPLHGYEPRSWRGTHVLQVHEAGEPWSTWCLWDERWSHLGWYVNLERPWRRHGGAIETMDHELDIVIAPDRSWEWKDEDRLAEWVAGGAHPQEEADGFRADGERYVRERLEPWTGPLATGWETWRPDPSWTVPELPDDWHER